MREFSESNIEKRALPRAAYGVSHACRLSPDLRAKVLVVEQPESWSQAWRIRL